VFRSWLSVVPEGALQWTMIGAAADMSKPIRQNSVSLCLDQLDPKKAERRPLSAFRIFGEEDGNPRYRFYVVADRVPPTPNGTATSFVEMRFADDMLERQSIEGFVDFARKCAETIPFDSGYASRSLCRSDTGRVSKSGAIISGLALRHPGFDIPVNHATRFRLGQKCRGAYWLTFLGPTLVDAVGGQPTFTRMQDADLQVSELGKRVMIRAGESPERGDVHRHEVPAALRRLAHKLEPIIFFGDSTLENEIFNGDEDKRERWERRFLSAGRE
jgi:hypothetical protein